MTVFSSIHNPLLLHIRHHFTSIISLTVSILYYTISIVETFASDFIKAVVIGGNICPTSQKGVYWKMRKMFQVEGS